MNMNKELSRKVRRKVLIIPYCKNKILMVKDIKTENGALYQEELRRTNRSIKLPTEN